MPSALYFLALLPPPPLSAQIHQLKKECAEKYHSSYSLKVPEHITIIKPFKMETAMEETLCGQLSETAVQMPAFSIALKNFGHFRNAVIFIHPLSIPEAALSDCYGRMKECFLSKCTFITGLQLEETITPHLTIAYRDLKPGNFIPAWNDFSQRNYEAAFATDSITLLRHDFGRWKILKEFPFSSTKPSC